MALPRADLHMHGALLRGDAQRVALDLRELGGQGLRRALVYLGAARLAPDAYLNLLAHVPIPRLQTYIVNGDLVDEVQGARDVISHGGGEGWPKLEFIPQVRKGAPEELRRAGDALTAGAVALKLIHAPDRVGVARPDLRRSHDAAITLAEAAGASVIVHVDLREEEDWVRSVLERAPKVTVCIAHLGYSRRRIAPLLDGFDLVTDIANLADHMLAHPDGYRSFMSRYSDRVVFGSDSFLGDASGVVQHAQALLALGLSDEASHGILSGGWERLIGDRSPGEASEVLDALAG